MKRIFIFELRNFKAATNPLFILLALFIVAKALFLFRYHLPGWDEAVYIGMGKYIYSLGNSGLWEIIRPPGLPLAVGWVWKLGLPYTFFSEIITVLFGAGSLVLTYLISKRLFSKNTAVLAAALLATAPWFFLYSSYILTEVPSLFFVLAAVLLFINKRYYLCGAAAALAMLFKFPNGLLIIALTIALTATIPLFRLGRLGKSLPLLRAGYFAPLLKAISSFIITSSPFLVFNYVFYRPFTSNPFDAVFRPFILGAWHQFNPAKAMAEPIYSYSFYLVEAFKQHFAFVLAVAAVFLFFKRKWFNDSGKLLLAIALALYFAYFSYIANKDDRFLILFLPGLCIFTAAAFFEVLTYFQRRLTSHARSFVLVAIVTLFALSFLVALYKDYSFYSWRPTSEPAIVQELYKSISKLGIKGPVLTSEPVFAAYNDNLFLAYYDSSKGIPKELKPSWDVQGKPFEAVIFSPQTLYCPENDLGCYEDRDRLHALIRSNFKEVFSGAYYEGLVSYSIFVNTTQYSS